MTGKPLRNPNVIRHRLGARPEVATARIVGTDVPEWSELSGMAFADEATSCRKSVRLVREGPESDLDQPFLHHGRNLVRDDVKSAFSSESGRWRRAATAP